MSRASVLGAVAVAAVCLGGCLAEPVAESLSEASAPIIGGQFVPGDGAVVALMDPGNGIFCTGTLVSRHVVLTAGHCVAFGAPPAKVYFGSDPDSGGETIGVQAYEAHPGFSINLDNDIAVVVLNQPAPAGVVPYGMATQAPTVGMNARHVGFGCRAATGACGPYGQKYQVNAPITEVNPTDFGYGVATCNGDSGGPAFVVENGREVVAGITSWGDETCAEYGYDTRVDAYVDFVTPFIRQYDPGRASGESCDVDSDCATALCEGVCLDACDPGAPSCVEGRSCLDHGDGRFACVGDDDDGGGGPCGCRAGGAGEGAGGLAALWLGVLGLLGLVARRRG